jgi:hypothetical protein
VEGLQAMHCPDMRWVHAARPSGVKRAAARSQVKLQALQLRKGLKENFVYLFYLSWHFKCWSVDTDFYLAEIDIPECFNFSSCSFKVNKNKKNVRCLQGISFLQLTFTKKIEIKNLGM